MDNKKLTVQKAAVCIFLAGFTILFICFLVGLGKEDGLRQSQVFFNRCNSYMSDFFYVISYSQDLNPYNNESFGLWEKAYLPLSYLLFFLVSKIVKVENLENLQECYSFYNVTIVGIMVAVMLGVLFVQLYDMLEMDKVYKFLIAGSLMLSGVTLFSYERGNIIILAVTGMVFFLVTYESENRVLKELGYIALAIAAALKGWPAILGLLLIYKKDWKGACRLILYGLAAAFLPFLLMKGGFSNVPLWWRNLKLNTEMYEFSSGPKLGYHYFIASSKELTYESQVLFKNIWQVIFAILSLIGIASNYFQKKAWIRIAMLISIILILPGNCGFYCLLYMLPVVVLYMNEKEKTWVDIIPVLLFLVMLSPLQIFSGTGENISYLICNIALMAFFLYLLCRNLWSLILYDRERKKVKAAALAAHTEPAV